MTALNVRRSALPRRLTKLFGCSCSDATCNPVTSAASPPDALQSAMTSETASVTDTPVWFALAIDFSWNLMKLSTSSGSARAKLSTWCSTSLGLATSPYTETTAIKVGTNAKNA